VQSKLLRYTFRRLAFAIVFVFLVSSSALLLARLAPGDVTSGLVPAGVSAETIARERARLGLDRPLLEQYVGWVGRAARLDLGESYLYQRPVGELVGERVGNSVVLGATALALATIVGLPLGVVAGARPGRIAAIVRAASVAALSVPPLICALALAFVAARTGWFPVGGLPPPDPAATWVGAASMFVWHLTLPALALALPFAATIEQLQAQAMTTALGEPHILAARARGVPETRLVWRHAWRTAIRPVAAVYGIIIGTLLSGSFAVEVVAARPGLGRLMYDALVNRDVDLVAGCAAAGAVFLSAGTLVSDLALAALDPRARQEAS
jgi:peptide/nickel transport system permease protein